LGASGGRTWGGRRDKHGDNGGGNLTVKKEEKEEAEDKLPQVPVVSVLEIL